MLVGAEMGERAQPFLAGATKPEQVAANVKAADWALSADDLAEINKITA